MSSLRTELLTDPDNVGYASLLNPRIDDQAVADLYNSQNKKKLVHTEIGYGLILETLGITAGNGLLDVLTTNPDFRYVKPLLEQGRLRVDSALVRATIDSLVPALLTLEQASALKALGEEPDIISATDVAVALGG